MNAFVLLDTMHVNVNELTFSMNDPDNLTLPFFSAHSNALVRSIHSHIDNVNTFVLDCTMLFSAGHFIRILNRYERNLSSIKLT